jgi:phosphatidylglycerol:prolipoprotein diacylglycerol transferase
MAIAGRSRYQYRPQPKAPRMLPAVLPYPQIDPVLIEIGPLAIRWYALAYLAGLLGGWRYLHWLNRRPPQVLTAPQIDDLLLWITLGVVLGGRVGYVLFYNAAYYLEHPLQALAIWHGGMSFHGGLIGVVLVIVAYAWRRRVALLALADLLACATPIGLFFGRLANFINGELYGRPTDVPWAMVFPGGGPQPRHPSQLYEAFLEGLVLFAVLFALARYTAARRRPGLLTGVFLAGYAVFRALVELVRQPDVQVGLLTGGSTMGQWLSLPLLLAGLWLIWQARRRQPLT